MIILVVRETLNLRVCFHGICLYEAVNRVQGLINQASNSASLKVLRIVTILNAIATKKAANSGARDDNDNVDVSRGFQS